MIKVHYTPLHRPMAIFFMGLFFSFGLFANVIEKKTLYFKVDIGPLLNEEIHYALEVFSPQELLSQYPELYDLDTKAFTQVPNVNIVLAKSVFVVDRPSGFFDHENMQNVEFLSHIMPDYQLKRVDENDFTLTQKASPKKAYRMHIFFDSDDISTLPGTKTFQAITQTKKIDVISTGATSTIYREFRSHPSPGLTGFQVISVIPLKENKTLLINYSLSTSPKNQSSKESLKKSFQSETLRQKSLIKSYSKK